MNTILKHTPILILGLFVQMSTGTLTDIQRQAIVNIHNYQRGNVIPSAAAMNKMRWNSTYELVAQRYTSKCVYAHNSNRTREIRELLPGSFNIGENIGAFAPSGTIEAFLKALMQEKINYMYDINKCKQGAVCGHYIQMVQASAVDFGCGHTHCPSMQGWSGCSKGCDFYVCNYDFGGFQGQKPYVSGPTCSACKGGCSAGLCV